MANKKIKHTGVEIRNNNVRISFTYEGKRVYETTHFQPSASGLKAAAALRQQILAEIQTGTFSYNKHFPDSSRALSDDYTFYDMAKRFISIKEKEVSASTLLGYRKILNTYWLPEFGDTPIKKVTIAKIRDALASDEMSELSAKTYNNALTPLRGVMALAIDYELISDNPCSRLKARKSQTPEPEPLDPSEMSAMLKALPDEWVNYFRFAFWTGMRTSEIIALEWSDIDIKGKTARVNKACVYGAIKSTKNYKARTVFLTPDAILALKDQRKNVRSIAGHVFTIDGQPILNDQPPRRAWNKAIKDSGIKHRKAYSTRHTFASMALMKGIDPFIVAQQTGHSVDMLLKHYARFIPSESSPFFEMKNE